MATVPELEHVAPTDTSTTTKVAYIMSRFPKLTETFVLYEMLAMERLGVEVEVCPLRREKTKTMHAEARPFVERAMFTPLLLSWRLLAAHLHYLVQAPSAYFATLWTLLRANWGSVRYFMGAIVYFPKAVYLARRLRQLGVHHVHAHFASHPAAVAYVIRQLAGIPYSFTAHGSDLHRDRHMLREKVTAAKAVVTISNYNRRLILEECGSDFDGKVHVIHCGVNLDLFQPRDEPTAFDTQAGPLRLACVGTLHEVKGQYYLIEACRLLQERGLWFECDLVGSGPDEAALRGQLRAHDLHDRVTLHGRQPQDRVRELLAGADVLVAPSVPTSCGRREGIPVVLMEAMSSGVPVVASDLSGIPELVEHNRTGLLVQPRDAEGLADALQRLSLNQKLREQLARAGRRKIEAEFNLWDNAEQLARHFDGHDPC